MSETLSSDAWVGPFLAPRNSASEAKGSIHDNATVDREEVQIAVTPGEDRAALQISTATAR